jgi:uncharacterized spore protein YtfJ
MSEVVGRVLMTMTARLFEGAREAISVDRVFGDPVERDGITLVPAAAVRGGTGGGTSEASGETPSGTGVGFGMSARPVGAYRIQDGTVEWVPAADTTRVIVLAELGAIVALLVLRSVLRRRRRKG